MVATPASLERLVASGFGNIHDSLDSADCGYPLGSGLGAQLKVFQSEISGRYPIIENCVRDTINLLADYPRIETLDRLVKNIEDEFDVWRKQRGGNVVDDDWLTREKQIGKRIRNAKIAITTMFLAGEAKALATGLSNYKRFIASVFGGEPWQEGVKAASPPLHPGSACEQAIRKRQ